MSPVRRSADRLARAVWTAPGAAHGAARAVLLPFAAAYRAGVAVRNAAYDAGLLRATTLPLPAVGVGNLAVGGAGKTPLVQAVARRLQARGRRVGILLRGYGGDEVVEHREALPEAVVVADADRRMGAAVAVGRGAQVLVLDDCLQHRQVAPEVMLALVAAESAAWPPWPLPAGPWREGLGALRRADAVVVTRKSASEAEAAALAQRLAARSRGGVALVASLRLGRALPLGGGAPEPLADVVAGRRVVAVCGVGMPESFAAQLREAGAEVVDLLAFGDHHAYTAGDVAAACRRAERGASLVTTAKDAVKLRVLWPSGAPPCHVALLDVDLGPFGSELERLLDALPSGAPARAVGPAAPSPAATR